MDESECKTRKMKEKELVLEQGKVYYLDYGNNNQIIGRYKDSDTCNHEFYDLLHYWNGYESFRHSNQHCAKTGIKNIRRASKSEIHNLIKREIENDCI